MKINSVPSSPSFKAVLFDTSIYNLPEKDMRAVTQIKRALDPYKRVDFTIGANENRELRVNYTMAKPYNMYLDRDLYENENINAKLGHMMRNINVQNNDMWGKKENAFDLIVDLEKDDLNEIVKTSKILAENFIERFSNNKDLN